MFRPDMEPPFTLTHQLTSEFNASSATLAQRLPGYPNILLQNRPKLLEFLVKEFYSDDLNRIADKLWWMSKQDSSNVSPLHRQLVKQRAIIVTEDPKLHLVWIHNRIFIKPLPRYIISYAFWRDCIGDGEEDIRHIRKEALGYIRTYRYLIRYESDFRIAQDPGLQLIPAEITWEQFCNFALDLANITDYNVSPRYVYGEIRLTRLNFYAPILLRKSHFQRVDYQYGTYFARFYGPVLFVIGVVSVALSGLQVAVAVDQEQPGKDSQLLSAVALWVSVVMIICFCGMLAWLGIIFVYKVAAEWRYAIRDRLRLLEEGLTNRSQ